MKSRSSRFALLSLCALLLGPVAGLRSASLAESPDALRQELIALQPPKLVWREIDWNYCLLDGIAKARAQKKPVLLWAFINSDPAEERC